MCWLHGWLRGLDNHLEALNPTLLSLVESRGYTLIASRRLFTCGGFCVAAVALLPVYQLRALSPWVTTALFAIATTFFGIAPSGFKANYLDITEKYVGVIAGYGNTFGTAASWAGPQLVAILLQSFGSWDIVLASVAVMNVCASLNYARHVVVTPIEQQLAAEHHRRTT